MNHFRNRLFLLLVLSSNLLFINAQQPVTITFNPTEGQVYSYSYFTYTNQILTGAYSTIQTFNKNAEGNYVQKTQNKELHIFDMFGDEVFSHNGILGEADSAMFIYQKLMNELVTELEIDKNGKQIKDFDFHNWLAVNGYSDNEIDEEFISFLSEVNQQETPFYLNQALTPGQIITLETEDEYTPSEYTVLEITDKYTVLKSFFNLATYDDNENNSFETVITIENASGVPLYAASAITIGEETLNYVLSRDDFKTINPAVLNVMYDDYNNNYAPTTISFTEEDKPYNKEEVLQQLELFEVNAHIQTKNYETSSWLMLETSDWLQCPLIRVNEAIGISKNDKRHLLYDQTTKQPNFDLYIHNQDKFPSIFAGDMNQTKKIIADIDVIGFYGKKNIELNNNQVGTRMELTKGPFVLKEWDSERIVASEGTIKAYNKKGKLLTTAQKTRIWPQYKMVAELLNIPEQDVSPAQAWLYAPLFPDYVDLWFYEYTFDQPVRKIMLVDAEGLVVDNRIVEATGIKEELLEETIKDEDVEIDMEVFEEIILLSEEEEEEEEPIFYIVEEMPFFPGGQEALIEYIQNSIQYPEDALANGIEGKIFVQFVIEKDGSLSNFTIVRGGHESLENEAIRIFKSMPLWTPGKQRNTLVKVFYTMPVNFQLP